MGTMDKYPRDEFRSYLERLSREYGAKGEMPPEPTEVTWYNRFYAQPMMQVIERWGDEVANQIREVIGMPEDRTPFILVAFPFYMATLDEILRRYGQEVQDEVLETIDKISASWY